MKQHALKLVLKAAITAAGILARVVPLFAQPAGVASVPAPVPGRILRFDQRLDRLIPPEARVEIVVTGRQWTEGPVWDRRDGSLLFSDVPANQVLRWKEGQGVRVVYQRSGYTGSEPFAGKEPGSNGLSFDHDGLLTLSEHGDRRVTRIGSDGVKRVLADRFEGKRLNSPNDNVWTSDGSLLFTDPPFGLPGTYHDPAKELPFSGVYRVRPGGATELLTKELRGPNGIAVSRDGRTLYLSNNDPARPVWMSYPLRSDGSLGAGTVLYDATPWTRRAPGLPDGLKLDLEDNLFGAGPGGVYIIAPDGTLLGLIETGVPTGNVAWGDDGTVLYIAANTEVQRVRTTTRGW
jgi:gluconolactonase